jgi:hypothetical protein
VERYIELTRAAASDDVNNLSKWWRQHEDRFPAMYQVTMEA